MCLGRGRGQEGFYFLHAFCATISFLYYLSAALHTVNVTVTVIGSLTVAVDIATVAVIFSTSADVIRNIQIT